MTMLIKDKKSIKVINNLNISKKRYKIYLISGSKHPNPWKKGKGYQNRRRIGLGRYKSIIKTKFCKKKHSKKGNSCKSILFLFNRRKKKLQKKKLLLNPKPLKNKELKKNLLQQPDKPEAQLLTKNSLLKLRLKYQKNKISLLKKPFLLLKKLKKLNPNSKLSLKKKNLNLLKKISKRKKKKRLKHLKKSKQSKKRKLLKNCPK